ncbi:GrpB family protein [Paenibacillus sp. B2(2019)]|uniref:GrpB family protein n=1 Tax=Paenibacillus sp. B2(2019) TaxID=2607754 RepID=UPI000FA6005F|nr:GrpB family protein [Paenibacillus sp. B2(2019)]KAA1183369.1 GrpB family protein [Paenibacillus sp. B2(2019)]
MDVTVTQYNEEWNLIFQEESRKIKEIFADALIDIHHIGSTSVTNRTHHIHVFQIDNKIDIDRHLAVRDYLRSHPEAAEQYGNLKEDLANQFPKDIEAYMDGKEAFVTELERTALECYSNH